MERGAFGIAEIHDHVADAVQGIGIGRVERQGAKQNGFGGGVLAERRQDGAEPAQALGIVRIDRDRIAQQLDRFLVALLRDPQIGQGQACVRQVGRNLQCAKRVPFACLAVAEHEFGRGQTKRAIEVVRVLFQRAREQTRREPVFAAADRAFGQSEQGARPFGAERRCAQVGYLGRAFFGDGARVDAGRGIAGHVARPLKP